jgi:hypothetical protein
MLAGVIPGVTVSPATVRPGDMHAWAEAGLLRDGPSIICLSAGNSNCVGLVISTFPFTKVEITTNLKTAKAFGLTVPRSLLATSKRTSVAARRPASMNLSKRHGFVA